MLLYDHSPGKACARIHEGYARQPLGRTPRGCPQPKTQRRLTCIHPPAFGCYSSGGFVIRTSRVMWKATLPNCIASALMTMAGPMPTPDLPWTYSFFSVRLL